MFEWKLERICIVLKTKDLVDLLKRNGWKFKRHGANHDIYVKDGKRESIVRHRETDEDLAKAIIRRNKLK
jgi:mRNA interferase HicA